MSDFDETQKQIVIAILKNENLDTKQKLSVLASMAKPFIKDALLDDTDINMIADELHSTFDGLSTFLIQTFNQLDEVLKNVDELEDIELKQYMLKKANLNVPIPFEEQQDTQIFSIEVSDEKLGSDDFKELFVDQESLIKEQFEGTMPRLKQFTDNFAEVLGQTAEEYKEGAMLIPVEEREEFIQKRILGTIEFLRDLTGGIHEEEILTFTRLLQEKIEPTDIAQTISSLQDFLVNTVDLIEDSRDIDEIFTTPEFRILALNISSLLNKLEDSAFESKIFSSISPESVKKAFPEYNIA